MSLSNIFRKRKKRRILLGNIFNRKDYKENPGGFYRMRSGEFINATSPPNNDFAGISAELKEFNRVLQWRGVQAISRLDTMVELLKSFDGIIRKVDERLGIIEKVIKIQVMPKDCVAKKKPKRRKR